MLPASPTPLDAVPAMAGDPARLVVDRAAALKTFESLASSQRLEIFCVLVKSGMRGMVAGELAGVLGLPGTNLSFHLRSMLGAGLVSVQQEGRFQRYRANTPHMLRVLAFVMENCACGEGGGETCAPAPTTRRKARRPRTAA